MLHGHTYTKNAVYLKPKCDCILLPENANGWGTLETGQKVQHSHPGTTEEMGKAR